jgi:hypothetical protein
MRTARLLVLAWMPAIVTTGCGGSMPSLGGGDASPAPPAAAPSAEDPLVQQARTVLRRADAEPLPTPLPPPSPMPKGWKPGPAPVFKPSEIEAVRLLEQAVAKDPKQAAAHELLGRILEPQAIREHDRLAVAKGASRRPPSPSPAPPDQGIDASPARVARAYRAAAEATATGSGALDALIQFGTRVGDLDAVDWAFRELIHRARENATAVPLARYGDFLRDQKKDVAGALEQYRNALIWAPDDPEIRAKAADIDLGLARELLAKQQYSAADARLQEAAKYVSDPASPQGQALAEMRRKLAEIR